MPAPQKPILWMNMTTSENWRRPPVGIVRVELELCEELRKILPFGTFKKCIWKDDQFVELLSPLYVSEQVVGPKQSRNQPEHPLNTSIERNTIFRPGDILLSVGLDWEYPYVQNFFELKKKGVIIVTCSYDLIPILFPHYCLKYVVEKFASYIIDMAEASSLIFCISQQTERDLRRFIFETGAKEINTMVFRLGDRVPTSEGTVGSEVCNLLSSPFILFVSTIEQRKNHEVLVRAYQVLCRRGYTDRLPKLLFVGMSGWGVDGLLREIEEDASLRSLILQLNHVSDAELRLLYEKALFCVYPSWYEGWGLPVAEALALGKAVLSSDRGPLPEIGGDLVEYIDPGDPEAWADAIWELSSNDAERKIREERVKMNYKVHSWADTAKSIVVSLGVSFNA